MGKDIKRVAIVGSSGGNLYAQGGDDPYTMMDEMFAQGSGVDIEISFIQFIGGYNFHGCEGQLVFFRAGALV